VKRLTRVWINEWSKLKYHLCNCEFVMFLSSRLLFLRGKGPDVFCLQKDVSWHLNWGVSLQNFIAFKLFLVLVTNELTSSGCWWDKTRLRRCFVYFFDPFFLVFVVVRILLIKQCVKSFMRIDKTKILLTNNRQVIRGFRLWGLTLWQTICENFWIPLIER
jgi:hypothetical protein